MNTLPDDMLVVIFSHAEMMWPYLRKVSRRWRHCLQWRDKHTAPQYMNWAAGVGRQVNLGLVSQLSIREYIEAEYYDLLMRAKYTLDVDGTETIVDDYEAFYRKMHINLVVSDKLIINYCGIYEASVLNFACVLFARIFCTNSKSYKLVIKCNDPQLLASLYNQNYDFDPDMYLDETTRKRFATMRYMGYKQLGIIRKCIARIAENAGDAAGCDKYKSIIKYLVSSGYAVTRVERMQAAMIGDASVMQLLNECSGLK